MQSETMDSNLKHASGGIEMEERKEPRFLTFDSPGKNVTGKLIRIDRVTLENGPVSRYTVEEGIIRGGEFVSSGECVAFLGTFMIDSKIRPSDVDHFVEVRYERETDVKRNGNAMKEFKVRVSKGKVETSDIGF